MHNLHTVYEEFTELECIPVRLEAREYAETIAYESFFLFFGCRQAILWARRNFTGLHVLDNRSTARRMLKKAVQQGRSERRGEAYASVR